MNNKEKLINYLNQNNENYFEIASELRDAEVIDYYCWTFREMFQDLDVDSVLSLIDSFGADYKFSLDSPYIEDQDGEIIEYSDDFYEWDYLGLEYEIKEADDELINEIWAFIDLDDDI